MNEPQSPRDWLLARNARATADLDALRRSALPHPSITWREFLGELFRPHRTAWRALALLWLTLAIVHFSRSPGAPPGPSAPADAFAAWLHQLKSHETFAQIDHRP